MDMKRRELDLSDPERANAWFLAFEAKARGKKLVDVKAEGDTVQSFAKTDLFLELCGEPAIMKLARTVKPLQLHDMEFSAIKQVANGIVEPKERLLIAERTNFMAIKINADESSDDLHIRINHAADRCNFERFRTDDNPCEELKKMVYINAFVDRKISKELLDFLRLTPTATFDDLKERVRQYRQTTEFVNRDDNNKPLYKLEGVANDVNSMMRHSRSNAKECGNCGSSHQPRRCPAYGKECHGCGKQGHFKKYCRKASKENNSKVFNNANVKVSNNYVDEDEHYFIGNVDDDIINSMESIMETVEINGVQVNMQHDTGASCTILSSALWREIGSPDLSVSNRKLSSYDNRGFNVLGECKLTVVREGVPTPINVQIVDSSRKYGLFGRDILKLSHIGSAEVSAEFLPVVKGVVATMKLKQNAEPKFCNARPVPLPMQAAATRELERLQAMGVIEPLSTGGAENASPVVWVKKPNGDLRMCADFSVHVNGKILSDSYPIPNTETIFSNLNGSKYFAKIDLKSAYWQIAIDEAAQNLSVLNTHKGLFKITRLQMGMKNSSSIFQQVIEKIVSGLKGVIPFQDDILIHAVTADSLYKRLNAVLERFKQRRLSINPEKCV